MELNLDGVKRKKNYLIMDSRIERTTETFEKQEIWNDFLVNVSYFIHLK